MLGGLVLQCKKKNLDAGKLDIGSMKRKKPDTGKLDIDSSERKTRCWETW
jgi:hypothetical protein